VWDSTSYDTCRCCLTSQLLPRCAIFAPHSIHYGERTRARSFRFTRAANGLPFPRYDRHRTGIQMRGDAEIVSAVRDAARDRTPLRIVGRGTWLDAGAPVSSTAQLTLSEDSGVVAYVPDDLTVTARAGTTLRDLGDTLGTHNQWIALDPEGVPDVTIGATVATCSFGPAAALFGTARDQVLGMSVVLGTGELIRIGGRVVKNVAGFDLTRLMIGAWGTLGVITEITFRVRSREMRKESVAHMRRQTQASHGYREPVIVHSELSTLLKRRFDPLRILNPGIMGEAP